MVYFEYMISSQYNNSTRQIERLLQERDEELARLDNLKKTEFRDTQRLSEIDKMISEIKRTIKFSL